MGSSANDWPGGSEQIEINPPWDEHYALSGQPKRDSEVTGGWTVNHEAIKRADPGEGFKWHGTGVTLLQVISPRKPDNRP
jgi:hypothetical protein